MIQDAPDHEGSPELDSTMKTTLDFVAHLGMVRRMIEVSEQEPRYRDRHFKPGDDPAARKTSRIIVRTNALLDGLQW